MHEYGGNLHTTKNSHSLQCICTGNCACMIISEPWTETRLQIFIVHHKIMLFPIMFNPHIKKERYFKIPYILFLILLICFTMSLPTRIGTCWIFRIKSS